jgi:hypothetical protein
VDEAVESAEPMHEPTLEPNVVPMTLEEAELGEEMQPLDEPEPRDDEIEQVSRGDEEAAIVDESEPELEHRGEENVQQEIVAQEPIRRSQRTRTGRTQQYDEVDWVLMNISVKRGLAERGKVALDACRKELVQMFKEKEVLHPVMWHNLSAEQKQNITKSHMFLKDKFDAMGDFEKMKARLVGDGRTQDRTVYQNTYSPTAAVRSLMTMLKIAAVEERLMMKVDIAGAYLCADIDDKEEVLLELDRELARLAVHFMPELKPYLRADGKLICQVTKALYGLIQAALLWYKRLTKKLKEEGFVENGVDPCVMNKMVNGKQVTIVIYVDDLLVLALERESLEWVATMLKKEFNGVEYKIADELSYLGMVIQRFPGKGVRVSMQHYLEGILEYYGKALCDYITPAKADLFKVVEAEASEEQSKFHTTTAKLLFMAKRTRPEVLLAVQYLCTRVREPTVNDVQKLERVLGFLRKTKTRGKWMDKSPFDRVVLYLDAAFACHMDGKGHSGGVARLGNTSVQEISKKHKMGSKDSTEAELVTASDHVVEGELLHEFLEEQGFELKRLSLLQDNAAVISMLVNGGGKVRTKHLRARLMLLREKVVQNEIEVQYIKTKEMIADILTKPLQGEQFHVLAWELLGEQRMRFLLQQGCVGKQNGSNGLAGDESANKRIAGGNSLPRAKERKAARRKKKTSVEKK